MEDILKSALSQVPGLVVLVVIVIVFLKFITKHNELIKALTDEHLYERKLTREALEKSAIANAQNASATTLNTTALNNMAHVITNQACKYPNK